MKDWEIIADNLSKAGWSWGCVSAIDSNGRTIWIADAHRDDGKRLVVRADEKLTAFVELESAIRASNEFLRYSGKRCQHAILRYAACRNKSSTDCRSAAKILLDYVIRRFNASSAGLKKPVGLDLRWDSRLTRSPDPTGTPSQPK